MNFLKEIILNLEFVRQHVSKSNQMTLDVWRKGVLEMSELEAKKLAEEKIVNLLSPVDLSQVVTLDKQRGIVYIGGEMADESTLANLKAEAEFLSQSELWKVITSTVRELAQKSMFVNGESLADMQKGKSILYTLSSQQNIVDIFKSYQRK
jgi:hypothetical protein